MNMFLTLLAILHKQTRFEQPKIGKQEHTTIIVIRIHENVSQNPHKVTPIYYRNN